MLQFGHSTYRRVFNMGSLSVPTTTSFKQVSSREAMARKRGYYGNVTPLTAEQTCPPCAEISLTFLALIDCSEGFKYRIIDFISEWFSHCYTVRNQTPANRHGVAKVARNVRTKSHPCLSSPLSAGLQAVQEIQLCVAPCGCENEIASLFLFALSSLRSFH